MTDIFVGTLPPQPAWTQTVTRLDGGREFSRHLGHARPVDAPILPIELVQTEHINWDAEPATIRRGEPQIRIDGHRYDLTSATDLARLMPPHLPTGHDPGNSWQPRLLPRAG